MKQLLFIPALLLSITIQAQTWFELGLKGGPATAFYLNQNIFDDVEFNHRLTGSFFFGGKFGINFGENNGIAFHVGGTKIRQNFDNFYTPSFFDQRLIATNLLEISTMYHRTSGSGYFEVGPRLSLVQSASLSDDGGTSMDITDELLKNYYGVDLGFGAFILGSKQLTLMAGFRFSYGIGPVMNTERPIVPALAMYETNKNVHILNAMLCFELNYSLGYLVKSSCGNRTVWLNF